MQNTTRSLIFAVLACMAMALFGKSPALLGSHSWISAVLVFTTLALSIVGFRYGMVGARQQRNPLAWVAPLINAMVFGLFMVFLLFLVRIMKKGGG